MRKLLMILLALCGAAGAAETAKDWEPIADVDGVKAWRREMPGTHVLAFKGQGLVEAPPLKVAAVLMDVSRKLEWVDRIREARLVRQVSPLERIEYNHSHVPWPLADRDFVFHAQADVEPGGVIVFKLKSVDEPSEPRQKSKERGELINSGYRLEPVEGGAKTLLTVEIHADPKGALPKWIANLVQKKWPLKTIQGIRKQAAREGLVESKELAELLNQKK